jgi:flagellar biosynthesis/type III secretory pathway M-ring protein FliF/YscJ
MVIAKAANSEGAVQVEKAVNFLTTEKDLDFDQALREILRFSTPETIAYDKALSEVGEKIRPMTPQSPEECSELIKLQRQYESIGRDKIQFIIKKIVGQATAKSSVNTDAAH